MALVIGTVTASVDSLGNVTLAGGDMALAWANALNPNLPTTQVLQYKTALNDDAKFQLLIDVIYVELANKLAQIATYINANISGGGGGFTPGGDLGGTSTTQEVIGWATIPLELSMLSPNDGDVPTYNLAGNDWRARAGGEKINGATVPAAGALTPGNVLKVSGVSALAYGAVNLAGGSNHVTGVLPTGNQASQAIGGDGSGTTAALTVIAWRGKSLDATTMGAPSDAQIPVWVNGSSAWKSLSVSGDVTLSNAGVTAVISVTPNPVTIPFADFQTRKVCWFSGASNGGTVSGGLHVWGWAQFVSAGSAASPALATSSKLAATERVTYSATSTSQLGIQEQGRAFFWRGNAAGRGGFYYRCRFAISSISTTAHLQSIVGLTNSLGPAFTNWITDTTVARVGLAFDLTSAAGVFSGNWQIVESTGSGSVTAHNLGASFAVTLNDYLELILYCAPNDSAITYVVNNLTTGATATGTLNTSIPTNTTFLAPSCKTNAATLTGGTQALDVAGLWCESQDT